VGLEYLFLDDSRKQAAIVRRAHSIRFPERPEAKDISYYSECLDYAEFQALSPGQARPHNHSGAEFLCVLRGKLELRIGAECHILASGDAIYFDASFAHSYRRVGKGPCHAIVVTVP
jgi:mannose-6-phosphate isomerase-like protein (cupin superfamily)